MYLGTTSSKKLAVAGDTSEGVTIQQLPTVNKNRNVEKLLEPLYDLNE
jgi:hypothetical protein